MPPHTFLDRIDRMFFERKNASLKHCEKDGNVTPKARTTRDSSQRTPLAARSHDSPREPLPDVPSKFRPKDAKMDRLEAEITTKMRINTLKPAAFLY